MLSASRGEPEYPNNVYSLHTYGTIYCFFYGGVDIEVVRHVAMAAVRAGSSLYQENKL